MGTLLNLDIDRKIYSGSNRIIRVCSILRLTVLSSRVKRSRNGNFHWIIKIRENLTPMQIVCIQAIMGSDWKRECFNMLRASQLEDKSELVNKHWNVLFK